MRNYNKSFFLAILLLNGILLFGQCPSGGVEIFSQQSVTDFQTAYPNCTTISGDLIINDSSDVVGGVYTADITSLVGLNKLETISGGLTIRSCTQLPTFIGLDNITSIGTDLFIIENDHADLDDFSGLGKLTTVPNSITIRLNDNLEDIFGLAQITGALTGQIKITDNPKLTDITQLNGITSTGSDVTIKKNNLSNLTGLENIQTIGGFLNIRAEPSLTSISVLSTLTSVGNNTLDISDNPLLTTLAGLENVTSINGSLYLSNNTELGNCDAVCSILVNDEATSYTVGGNKEGSTCQYLTALQTHCGVPLPIELTYFVSRKDASFVYLEWETSSEMNNDGLFVEKSRNGRDWEAIAWVDGNGTTSDLHTYHFVDRMPYDGINYYRLKQVDYDGKFEYSHVISEYLSNTKHAGAHMYPNPARDLLFIQHQLKGNVKVTLYDAYGKSRLASHLTSAIDVSMLADGIYYVKIYNDTEVLDLRKVVILR